MLDQITALFKAVPYLALFVSLFLGYLIGWVKVRSVSLGGICGTLVVAILIGQLGVTISDDAKNIAFATFIFALGFTAGPQFFANLNRQGLKLGVFTLIEVAAVLLLIVVWAEVLGLDPGTAAGLAAGSATESAMLGTATDAIGGLPVDPATVSTWQANVATAYSLSYLFGLITIVLFTSQFAEKIIRVDLRAEAERLWTKLGGSGTLKPGQAPAVPTTSGRIYDVESGAGRTVSQIEAGLGERATVERIRRDDKDVDVADDVVLQRRDAVLLVGRQDELVDAEKILGRECADRNGLNMTVESRDIWLTASRIDGKTLQQVQDQAAAPAARGVYLGGITRGVQTLPPLPGTVIRAGDVVTLTGAPRDLDRVTSALGRLVPRTDVTDFVYLGLGVTLGILIGRLAVHLGSVPISLGTGGGCLLTGLVFGWFHSRRPTLGNYPPAAAQYAKDLGLATFIAATGLSVGPQAAALIGQYGLLLPLAGILTVLIPATISLLAGHWWLKIDSPVLLGAIAGQQCSTPAGTGVVEKVGNSVPMIGYTVTYALSNVVLPLVGPLVVLLIFSVT